MRWTWNSISWGLELRLQAMNSRFLTRLVKAAGSE
jgi:hypothetical protein